VWEPILPTDISAPTTAVLGRLSDARVQQYWDQNHVLARRMRQDAREPQPTQECCVQNQLLWDLAAVYPAGVNWDSRMPPAVVFNGPVVDVTDAIARALVPMAVR
jgi:hypothetical protein